MNLPRDCWKKRPKTLLDRPLWPTKDFRACPLPHNKSDDRYHATEQCSPLAIAGRALHAKMLFGQGISVRKNPIGPKIYKYLGAMVGIGTGESAFVFFQGHAIFFQQFHRP